MSGGAGGLAAAPPAHLLLGSLHCHSTASDGSGRPEDILAKAASVGLDFVAITDHVPRSVSDTGGPADSAASPAGPPATAAPSLPLAWRGVLRLPGLEFSPDRNHCLVLGLDPQDVPDPDKLPGWPDPASYLGFVSKREGVACFAAHPDDAGNSFLKVRSFAWDRWDLWEAGTGSGGRGAATGAALSGLEVWNLSTDWSRHIKGYGDIVRAEAAGFFRAVPPPNPATLARWDSLGQTRRVAAIAGTDAHAYPARWHGLRFTILPYAPSFSTLQMAVRIPSDLGDSPPEDRVRAITKALGEGRSFIVNRVWGHPSSFSFEARRVDGSAVVYQPGDTVPAGAAVRFEVNVPWAAWIRLIRNGQVMGNTYGREMSFEPLPAAAAAGDVAVAGEAAAGDANPAGDVPRAKAATGAHRQEAWRVEVWTNAAHWTKAGSGWFLWILTNFIYREVGSAHGGIEPPPP